MVLKYKKLFSGKYFLLLSQSTMPIAVIPQIVQDEKTRSEGISKGSGRLSSKGKRILRIIIMQNHAVQIIVIINSEKSSIIFLMYVNRFYLY